MFRELRAVDLEMPVDLYVRAFGWRVHVRGSGWRRQLGSRQSAWAGVSGQVPPWTGTSRLVCPGLSVGGSQVELPAFALGDPNLAGCGGGGPPAVLAEDGGGSW